MKVWVWAKCFDGKGIDHEERWSVQNFSEKWKETKLVGTIKQVGRIAGEGRTYKVVFEYDGTTIECLQRDCNLISDNVLEIITQRQLTHYTESQLNQTRDTESEEEEEEGQYYGNLSDTDDERVDTDLANKFADEPDESLDKNNRDVNWEFKRRDTWDPQPSVCTDQPRLIGFEKDLRTATPFDYFAHFLPTIYIVSVILVNTNQVLVQKNGPDVQPLKLGEFLKFLGCWVFMMVFPILGGRRNYWATNYSEDDVFPAPRLFRFIKEKRFEQILASLRVVSDDCWNRLNDPLRHTRDFIIAMNNQVQSCFSPGPYITPDESMIAGFSWFLTCVTVILRKPRPVGHELKTVCCALTCICINAEVQEGKEFMATKSYRALFPAAVACTMRLCEPWMNTHRIVIADSWFGSVATAVALLSIGLYCILNIKTGHTNYPRERLMKRHTGERGTFTSAVGKHRDGAELLACTWKDKTIFQLLGTAGTTAEGSERVRASGRLVPRPMIHADYLGKFNAVDVFNKIRHGTGGMEDVWVSLTPWHRMFAGSLGFIIANAYLAYAHFSTAEKKMSRNEFLQVLATELLTNTWDERESRSSSRQSGPLHSEVMQQHTITASYSTVGKNKQRHCVICHAKVRTFCLECGQDVPLCTYSSTQRHCQARHAEDPDYRPPRHTPNKRRKRA